MRIDSAEGWQVSSCERAVSTKQPQHMVPSVHGWLLNKINTSLYVAHKWLADVPVCSSYHNNLLILSPRRCGLSPLTGQPMPPFSFSRHLVSPCLLLWPELFPALLLVCSPCPSTCVFPNPGVRHCTDCTAAQFWGYGLFMTHYSLLILYDGRAGCGLGGWMNVAMNVVWLAPLLTGWLWEKCFFSLHKCPEPQNGLAWISILVSSPASHLVSPPSFCCLKATQNNTETSHRTLAGSGHSGWELCKEETWVPSLGNYCLSQYTHWSYRISLSNSCLRTQFCVSGHLF